MAQTFDEGQLLERVDNDIGFLAETVEMLATDGKTLLAETRKAMDAGDAPGVARSAHALKGMISNFCAATAQQGSLEVERIGKSGDLAQGPDALAKLQTQVESLTAELLQFVQARS